jgi:hypothetical protein
MPLLDERYYTLIASLPALPFFEAAERLPINRERLDRRLRMLNQEDAAMLALARRLTDWRQPLDLPDADFVRRYRAGAGGLANPRVAGLVAARLEMRTAIGALRRRAAGRPAPVGTDWGVGPWLRRLADHWAEPDFGLRHVLPWLPQARTLLEDGDHLGLERLAFAMTWEHCRRAAEVRQFGPEAVVAYVFRWDILRRWLSHDAQSAAARIEALAAAALRGRSSGSQDLA